MNHSATASAQSDCAGSVKNRRRAGIRRWLAFRFGLQRFHAATRAQFRAEITARRHAPIGDALGISAVRAGIAADPAQRRLRILHGAGEFRFVIEAIIDRHHDIAACGQRRHVLGRARIARAAVRPAAAVAIDGRRENGPAPLRRQIDVRDDRVVSDEDAVRHIAPAGSAAAGKIVMRLGGQWLGSRHWPELFAPATAAIRLRKKTRPSRPPPIPMPEICFPLAIPPICRPG